MATLLVLNGPNLNLLGTRQPEVYGATSLQDIENICVQQAASVGATLAFFQSNHEGDLIDQIHAAKGQFDGILLNAGALSHTSIAIMDAISSVEVPTIDIHLSNIHGREKFRHVSYVSKVAVGSIVGFGPGSYLLAIDAMMMHLDNVENVEIDYPDQATDPSIDTLETRPEQRVDPPALLADDTPDAVDMSPIKPVDEDALETKTTDVSKFTAAAAAAIAAQAQAINAKKDEYASSPNSNPAFNEMFDTPPKEVLESLGIPSPELLSVKKSEPDPIVGDEPDIPDKAQVRNFRKLS